ncbi:MAG: carbon-nitrogen hydrolase [Myxococcales bacterium]|nr:MAG: carbon-nitrogen hydrolase [Myxococcales bacterium]
MVRRLVLAQIAPKLGLVEENAARHQAIVREARAAEADLVLFPELSLTGYLLKDLVSDVALSEAELLDLFAGLGPGRPIEIAVGWLERSPGYQVYNALAHLRIGEDGGARLLHNHRKVNLPTYGMFEEERYFSSGKLVRAYDSPLLGRTGMLICEDMWHPANPLLLSLDGPGLEGVNTILVGSNSPSRGTAEGGQEPANAAIWRLLARYTALTANCLVAICQRVGVEDGFVYVGGSEIIGPGGLPLARAPLFDEAILTCDVELDSLIRERRMTLPGGALDDYDRLRRELERIGRRHLEDER